jgi:hypothetical protein
VSGERFEARLPPDPGDVIAGEAVERMAGQALSVVTASGRRVAGRVVDARLDDTGALLVTVEADEAVLPPLDPGAFTAQTPPGER